MYDLYLHEPRGESGRDGDTEARILRERQASLRARMDLAATHPDHKAARIALSVFDGGQMPNQPDHFFLGHPVSFDGAEQEGGTFTPAIDTLTTIPFVALHSIPSVGDVLTATAVGGRWVAERSKSGPCVLTVCVGACGGLPVFGASVALIRDGETVASGTTGAGGCVSFSGEGIAAGTYTVQVTVSGSVAYSSPQTLACGVPIMIEVGSGAGLVCCGGYAIPTVLTLTDAAGSMAFVYNPNYFFPLWTGGHSVQIASCVVTTPNNICVVWPETVGPVRICYQMICHAGQSPTFAIQRSWSWVYDSLVNPHYFQDPSGFAPGQFCITAPPAICGNPLTDTASFGANPTSASPFVLSGTPAAAPSNATGDPVGGSITISA